MDFEQFLKLDLREKFGETKNSYSNSLEGVSALSRVKDILRKVDSKQIMKHNRKLEESCKKCGEKEVYCGYIENGVTSDYHDNFWHICLGCLDAVFYEHTVGNGSMETPDDTKCPWCNHQQVAGFGN
ncbi:Uncharacterised protein [uncultured archaeon]|nr:Uncharacterised protein [uncultured archaeon]